MNNYYQNHNRTHGSHKIGPAKTPKIIKFIIFATLIISLLASFLSPFFNINYFINFLGLSIDGIKNFYFWQLFTFNFLEPSYGVTISYIFDILFKLYLMWIMGSSVVERTSEKRFLILFISSIIFSGLISLMTMHLLNKHIIFSSINIGLFTILISWMMLNMKDTKVFLFFVLPIKAHWIPIGIILITLVSNLSNTQSLYFCTNLAVSIFTYLYTVIFWHRFSPFQTLHKMERLLIKISRKFLEIFKKHH